MYDKFTKSLLSGQVKIKPIVYEKKQNVEPEAVVKIAEQIKPAPKTPFLKESSDSLATDILNKKVSLVKESLSTDYKVLKDAGQQQNEGPVIQLESKDCYKKLGFSHQDMIEEDGFSATHIVFDKDGHKWSFYSANGQPRLRMIEGNDQTTQKLIRYLESK